MEVKESERGWWERVAGPAAMEWEVDQRRVRMAEENLKR